MSKSVSDFPIGARVEFLGPTRYYTNKIFTVCEFEEACKYRDWAQDASVVWLIGVTERGETFSTCEYPEYLRLLYDDVKILEICKKLEWT